MNYHNILHDNMLNGEGLRVVLFVSGCEHNCPSCHNPQTHNFSSGIPFDIDAVDEIFEQLNKPYIKGLTISGGDPLHEKNVTEVSSLCKTIKSKYPDKDIWIYSGYTLEQLTAKQMQGIKYADVLVDGKYIDKLRNVNAPYVGSTNQRIIYLKDVKYNE